MNETENGQNLNILKNGKYFVLKLFYKMEGIWIGKVFLVNLLHKDVEISFKNMNSK